MEKNGKLEFYSQPQYGKEKTDESFDIFICFFILTKVRLRTIVSKVRTRTFERGY